MSRIGGEADALKGELAALQRHVFGRRAEKLPTVAAELRQAAPQADSKAARHDAAKRNPDRSKNILDRQSRAIARPSHQIASAGRLEPYQTSPPSDDQSNRNASRQHLQLQPPDNTQPIDFSPKPA